MRNKPQILLRSDIYSTSAGTLKKKGVISKALSAFARKSKINTITDISGSKTEEKLREKVRLTFISQEEIMKEIRDVVKSIVKVNPHSEMMRYVNTHKQLNESEPEIMLYIDKEKENVMKHTYAFKMRNIKLLTNSIEK